MARGQRLASGYPVPAPVPHSEDKGRRQDIPAPCLPNGEQGRIRVGGSAASQYDAHLKIRKVQ